MEGVPGSLGQLGITLALLHDESPAGGITSVLKQGAGLEQILLLLPCMFQVKQNIHRKTQLNLILGCRELFLELATKL